jgi:hypothetical protein
MLEANTASAEDMLVSASPSKSEELRTALKTAVDPSDIDALTASIDFVVAAL